MKKSFKSIFGEISSEFSTMVCLPKLNPDSSFVTIPIRNLSVKFFFLLFFSSVIEISFEFQDQESRYLHMYNFSKVNIQKYRPDESFIIILGQSVSV